MTIPNTFTQGTKAKASEVNANFDYVEEELDKSKIFEFDISSISAIINVDTSSPSSSYSDEESRLYSFTASDVQKMGDYLEVGCNIKIQNIVSSFTGDSVYIQHQVRVNTQSDVISGFQTYTSTYMRQDDFTSYSFLIPITETHRAEGLDVTLKAVSALTLNSITQIHCSFWNNVSRVFFRSVQAK